MKLGDVLDETRTPAPGPPRGRRLRWGFWLVTAGLLTALLVRHGPGVGSVSSGESAVIYNLTGAGWLGEKPRVEVEGVFFYLPLLQQVVRVKTKQRELRVARHLARTRDGVAIDLAGIDVRYALRAKEAPKLLAAIGEGTAELDRFAESVVRAAATEALRQSALESLTTPDAAARVRAAMAREAGRQLAQLGIELIRLTEPKWSVAGPLRVALSEARAAQARTAELREQARAQTGTAARRRHEVATKRQAGHFELKRRLFAEVDEARAAAADLRREAERYAILRAAEGQAVKAELETMAETDAAVGRMRAQGIQARVQALGADPSGLLDQTIASELLPKLRRPRKPAPPDADRDAQKAPPDADNARDAQKAPPDADDARDAQKAPVGRRPTAIDRRSDAPAARGPPPPTNNNEPEASP